MPDGDDVAELFAGLVGGERSGGDGGWGRFDQLVPDADIEGIFGIRRSAVPVYVSACFLNYPRQKA